MTKFNQLLPPQMSSPAQFTAYWVCVENKDNWFLSNDGDIKAAEPFFGKGEYNQQFWFDYDFDAWFAIVKYYHAHGEPFPYKNHITSRFISNVLHKNLLSIYGEDGMWWMNDNLQRRLTYNAGLMNTMKNTNSNPSSARTKKTIQENAGLQPSELLKRIEKLEKEIKLLKSQRSK